MGAKTPEQREAARQRRLARKARRAAEEATGSRKSKSQRRAEESAAMDAERERAFKARAYDDITDALKIVAHFEKGSKLHDLLRSAKIEAADWEVRPGGRR